MVGFSEVVQSEGLKNSTKYGRSNDIQSTRSTTPASCDVICLGVGDGSLLLANVPQFPVELTDNARHETLGAEPVVTNTSLEHKEKH